MYGNEQSVMVTPATRPSDRAGRAGAGLTGTTPLRLHLSRSTPRTSGSSSTQCGFSSAGPGNAISQDAQERTLQLVAEVARRAWG
jgi:hypothetical protein